MHDELSEVEEEAVVPGAFRTHHDGSPPEMSTIWIQIPVLVDESEFNTASLASTVGRD